MYGTALGVREFFDGLNCSIGPLHMTCCIPLLTSYVSEALRQLQLHPTALKHQQLLQQL